MKSITATPAKVHLLEPFIHRLLSGDALLPDSTENVMEVVGILKSYGVVLDAYWRNLVYIADHQFLVLFPFFKYFNGEVSFQKLLRHWWHDRINYEYAEYAMRVMMWHGGGPLDAYLDTPEFVALARQAIAAKIKGNPMMQALNRLCPDFLVEQVRQSVYYSALGQFWQVMAPMFLNLSDRYDHGEIESIPDVVQHILNGLVAAANQPIQYVVKIGDQAYEIIPKAAGFTFLMDVAVPYVETVFFRGTPFFGTVSYNAQANQISSEQDRFTYGALYADPLPTGGAGIPPTLLMQDMRHYLPDYLQHLYLQQQRGNDDLRVKICQSFQKSMFCVTTAAILGLMPHARTTTDPIEQKANHKYLENWMDRFLTSQLLTVQIPRQVTGN
jgi:CO2 hydration protein